MADSPFVLSPFFSALAPKKLRTPIGNFYHWNVMTINREELKEAIRDLVSQDPEFLAEIVGDIIRGNLRLDTHRGQFSDDDTPCLLWDRDSFTWL